LFRLHAYCVEYNNHNNNNYNNSVNYYDNDDEDEHDAATFNDITKVSSQRQFNNITIRSCSVDSNSYNAVDSTC